MLRFPLIENETVMATLLLTRPDDLLGSDIMAVIERVWLGTRTDPAPHRTAHRRRDSASFREFNAYDGKEGTNGEYLPTAEPRAAPDSAGSGRSHLPPRSEGRLSRWRREEGSPPRA
jgi:hypothetical protein